MQLSVSVQEAGLSADLFHGMWQKAAKLLASITDAPLSNSKMVTSFSNPTKPNLFQKC